MSDNNGWPDKPGVPLNPERDWWHWFDDGVNGTEPRFWGATFAEWDGYPLWIAKEWCYLGPALTPAQVDARIATARKDAAAEAALRLEELHKNHKYNPQTGEGSEHDAGYYRAIAEGVAHILALAKGEGDD